MDTGTRFAEFAVVAELGGSPIYATWAQGFAVDPVLLAVVDRARPSQRQPVLVFAVCRFLGAPLGDFVGLRTWILDHDESVLLELDLRFTQTNDVRRVAPVALALTRIPGPVALLEVGASAGLGLWPDRFAIVIRDDEGETVLGDPSSSVRIRTVVRGSAFPNGEHPALPEIVWRSGLDVAPLDPTLARDRRWLETLLWPGQDDRVALLRAAIGVGSRDPVSVVEGDAVDGLAALADTAPTDATLAVVTTGTLVYLPGARRQAFVDLIGALGARWISYERTGLLDAVHATVPVEGAMRAEGAVPSTARSDAAFATLALDGRAIGFGDPHATTLRIFDGA